MPSLLTRSKSLRLLTGSRRVHRGEHLNSIPSSDTPQTNLDRLKSATPVPTAQRTLDAPEMPTRPSTSGGPGERAIQFHKRSLHAPSVVSEDRFLALSSATDFSVVLQPIQQQASQEYIGIALGSPTATSHSTSASTSQVASDNLAQNPQMDRYGNTSAVTLGTTREPTKPKVSRWKSFFRKASSPLSMSQSSPREKQPFYQLDQPAAAARADSPHDASPVSESKSRQEEQASSVSPTAYDPEIRASRKTSVVYGGSETGPDGQARQRAATAPSQPSTPGLLDIAIPDIQMERYSVMFSGVLGPSNRSSLLERRQPNAEKVKPLNQLTAKVRRVDHLPLGQS
jgi:hypothetical protein